MSTSGTPWSTVEDAVDYGSSLLRGRRCRLRALAEDDLPRLDAWWGDVETLALQGEVIRPQPAATREASIRMWSRNDTSGGVGFSVVDLSTEELVGHVTLWGIEARGRCATLSAQIGAPFLGHGYGTDAVRTLVAYAFSELGLHRVQLGAWAFNSRALAAYANAGFTEEGRRREVVFHDGHWYDEVLMSVLEDDWWSRDDDDEED